MTIGAAQGAEATLSITPSRSIFNSAVSTLDFSAYGNDLALWNLGSLWTFKSTGGPL